VPIFDVGRHDGRDYFAMGFMPGGSLAECRDGCAEPRAAAALVEKVARAMQHAHEHGVLHRDLKPGNILLDEQGEPRVSDFGLAKFRDSDVELTRTGAVFGTSAYMAPEQADGQVGRIGPATDVWALGVILYELLTGRRPFVGRGREEVAFLIYQADPPRPRALRPGLDRALETVTLKCLEKRPGQRYPSAGALADDLARWLAGEPVVAQPPSRVERLRRLVRRHPAAVVASALAVAFLVVVASLWGVRYRAAETEPAKENLLPIQRALADGKTVALVSADGLPMWYRWRVGRAELRRPDGQPATLALRNWHDGVIELLPDRPGDRYRLRAEVRINQKSAHAFGGVYVAHCERPAPGGGMEQWWVGLAFSDDEPAGKVVLDLHRYRAGQDPPYSSERLAGHAFANARHSGRWRSLRVDVTPEQVTAFWEGEQVAAVGLAGLDRSIARLAAQQPGSPDEPSPESLLKGGLGFQTREADTWFRNVVVEPLK
jgi:serine/threonine-protein kinase